MRFSTIPLSLTSHQALIRNQYKLKLIVKNLHFILCLSKLISVAFDRPKVTPSGARLIFLYFSN